MNNEEKILEMLSQLQGQVAQLSQLQDQVAQIKEKQDLMGEDLHRVKAYLELDVEKRFDAVNLGIDTIQEKLELRERLEERVDKLENDVIVLKTAAKLQSEDILELKKAQ